MKVAKRRHRIKNKNNIFIKQDLISRELLTHGNCRRHFKEFCTIFISQGISYNCSQANSKNRNYKEGSSWWLVDRCIILRSVLTIFRRPMPNWAITPRLWLRLRMRLSLRTTTVFCHLLTNFRIEYNYLILKKKATWQPLSLESCTSTNSSENSISFEQKPVHFLQQIYKIRLVTIDFEKLSTVFYTFWHYLNIRSF